MIVSALAEMREKAAPKDGAIFVARGAEILTMLERGSSGAQLRQRITDAVAPLTRSAVVLSLTETGLQANSAGTSPADSHVWQTHLRRGGATTVEFARHTSERELLLFCALLVAPGEAGHFAEAWAECGAWRIHVNIAGAADADSVQAVAASGTPPTTLEGLCRAVEQGLCTPDSPAFEDLRRHGADATAALFERLGQSPQGSRRRYLFDAIVAVNQGAEELIAALTADAWYLARNAAALIGEMKIDTASDALVNALAHDDPRVRAAASTALGQLNGSGAVETLVARLKDDDARVRLAIWRALSLLPSAPPAATVDAALRTEQVDEVKRAILDCVAAFPSLEVTGGLTRFCAREFTHRTNVPLLLYGVEQLAIHGRDAAAPFVKRLPELWAAAS